MSFDAAIMAVDARAAEAREDAISGRHELPESAPSLSGWRAGLAVLVVATVVLLLASPVLAAAGPAAATQAVGWLSGFAGVTPVLLGARALVFIVALVVITRPVASRDGAS
jgi:hypothetical protein